MQKKSKSTKIIKKTLSIVSTSSRELILTKLSVSQIFFCFFVCGGDTPMTDISVPHKKIRGFLRINLTGKVMYNKFAAFRCIFTHIELQNFWYIL